MLCQWLETEGELYSLVELHDKMKEFAQSDDIYSLKWFKAKIKEKKGLSCVAACWNCHGENCENKAVVTDEDAYEDEERNIFDVFESFTS